MQLRRAVPSTREWAMYVPTASFPGGCATALRCLDNPCHGARSEPFHCVAMRKHCDAEVTMPGGAAL